MSKSRFDAYTEMKRLRGGTLISRCYAIMFGWMPRASDWRYAITIRFSRWEPPHED